MADVIVALFLLFQEHRAMLCKTLIVNSEVKDIFIEEKGYSIPGIKVYPDY